MTGEAAGDAAICTHGLGKSYRGAPALDALDLRVPRGSIFGFLGPNGAGKTTTIKLLLGLTRPAAGSACVLGRPVATDGLAIRQRIGYLGQQPQFYDHLTARETLRFTARLFFAGPRVGIERRVDEMLDLVGLTGVADRTVRGFSGGERQRLGIAQAQINDPELLILDEPAAALDPIGRRDVLEIMGRLRETTTIFYSTHILDDVERVSDTVAILAEGRLVTQAPVADLLRGASATYALTVRGAGAAVRDRLSTLPWVTAVDAEPAERATTLKVRVSDERAADRDLLRLALDQEDTTVTSYGRAGSHWKTCSLTSSRRVRPDEAHVHHATHPAHHPGCSARPAPRADRRVAAGFGPMLRKELGQWWCTRQWLVQAFTWLVVINGIVALVLLGDDAEDSVQVFSCCWGCSARRSGLRHDAGRRPRRGRARHGRVGPRQARDPGVVPAEQLIGYAVGFGALALTLPWWPSWWSGP